MNVENSQIIKKVFWNNMCCDITGYGTGMGQGRDRNGTGMEQGWDRDGTGTGQGRWDGTGTVGRDGTGSSTIFVNGSPEMLLDMKSFFLFY